MTPDDPVGGGIGGGAPADAAPCADDNDCDCSTELGLIHDDLVALTDAEAACCEETNTNLTTINTTLTDGSAHVVVDSLPAAVERKVDGDDISGAGSIVIPDGALSFSATVYAVGAGVTINGPDFASATALFDGQSVGHSADENNTLNGPITITTTAGSIANAIWVTP